MEELAKTIQAHGTPKHSTRRPDDCTLQGGCGQVLDNAHGNVYFGVANGTACTMHSLAWDDPEDKKSIQRNKNINTRSRD